MLAADLLHLACVRGHAQELAELDRLCGWLGDFLLLRHGLDNDLSGLDLLRAVAAHLLELLSLFCLAAILEQVL